MSENAKYFKKFDILFEVGLLSETLADFWWHHEHVPEVQIIFLLPNNNLHLVNREEDSSESSTHSYHAHQVFKSVFVVRNIFSLLFVKSGGEKYEENLVGDDGAHPRGDSAHCVGVSPTQQTHDIRVLLSRR
jgi:hypothetical protein